MKHGRKIQAVALIASILGVASLFQNCSGFQAGSNSAGPMDESSFRILSMANTTETPISPPGNIREESWRGFIEGIDTEGYLNGWVCYVERRKLGS